MASGTQFWYPKMSNFRKDETSVTFSYHPCRHLLSIALPYRVCMLHNMYQCKGDRLYHFLHCHSNYPKYDTLFYYSLSFLTPSFFPFEVFWTDRQKDRFLHPLFPNPVHIGKHRYIKNTKNITPGAMYSSACRPKVSRVKICLDTFKNIKTDT